MKAFVFLADYAASHADGTLSATRAMINQLNVKPGVPAGLRGYLVGRLSFDQCEQGGHVLEVKCLDEAGRNILPPGSRQFDVTEETRDANVISQLLISFPQPGKYRFLLEVDSSPMAQWDFEVKLSSEEGTE